MTPPSFAESILVSLAAVTDAVIWMTICPSPRRGVARRRVELELESFCAACNELPPVTARHVLFVALSLLQTRVAAEHRSLRRLIDTVRADRTGPRGANRPTLHPSAALYALVAEADALLIAAHGSSGAEGSAADFRPLLTCMETIADEPSALGADEPLVAGSVIELLRAGETLGWVPEAQRGRALLCMEHLAGAAASALAGASERAHLCLDESFVKRGSAADLRALVQAPQWPRGEYVIRSVGAEAGDALSFEVWVKCWCGIVDVHPLLERRSSNGTRTFSLDGVSYAPGLGATTSRLRYQRALVGGWLHPDTRSRGSQPAFLARKMSEPRGHRAPILVQPRQTTARLLVREQSAYQEICLYESTVRPRRRWLTLNGSVQWHSDEVRRSHRQIVTVPLGRATRMPDVVRRVLVIGGGDGFAAQTLLEDPRIEHVINVELDPAMVSLSREHPLLRQLNGDAFNDARVEVVVDDGLAYLAREHQPFDVIIDDCEVDFTNQHPDLRQRYKVYLGHLVSKLQPWGVGSITESPGITYDAERDLFIPRFHSERHLKDSLARWQGLAAHVSQSRLALPYVAVTTFIFSHSPLANHFVMDP